MASFTGKVALVTGGSSGIGREAALAFARSGAKVVVSARRVQEGEAVVEQIRAEGGDARFIAVDVAQADSVKALVDRTMEAYGRLDAAFNNAGIEGTFAPIADLSEADWDQAIDINLKGAWLSLKYQVPAMLHTGGGAIVFTSSIVGMAGMPGTTIYAASKAGVIGLTKSAAVEYAAQGIRVNAISPGAIETPMAERVGGGDVEAWRRQMVPLHPIGRVGQPLEAAAAAVWLCSEEASFITGQILAVDGGFLSL